MELNRLAKIRNFNKFRLLGFCLNTQGLTENERIIFSKFKNSMLEEWDNNSKILGLNPRPKCIVENCNNKTINSKYCKFHNKYINE